MSLVRSKARNFALLNTGRKNSTTFEERIELFDDICDRTNLRWVLQDGKDFVVWNPNNKAASQLWKRQAWMGELLGYFQPRKPGWEKAEEISDWNTEEELAHIEAKRKVEFGVQFVLDHPKIFLSGQKVLYDSLEQEPLDTYIDSSLKRFNEVLHPVGLNCSCRVDI